MGESSEYIKILRQGGIGVVPTDTIYGVIGSAHNVEMVERIYALKGRDENKPFIILISDILELVDFGIALNNYQITFAKQMWPGPHTLIFSIDDNQKKKQYEYLHRGQNSLGFRIPDYQFILDLIREVGPLVAPSANPQGKDPAQTITEARAYFEESVDFYHDGGEVIGSPSSIFEVHDNSYNRLR